MIKLAVIARSNLDIHEFCLCHGINESDVLFVKSLEDLEGKVGLKYVLLPPGPRNFHCFIRPYLIVNKFINVTKFYNLKSITK